MLKDNPFRLSKNIKPLKYVLFLDTDLKSGKFSGNLQIDLKIEEETNIISMNSIDLSFNEVIFKSKNNNINLKKIEIDKNHEIINLIFPETLKQGNASLNINYNGNLSSKLNGFYKSSFKGIDGKTLMIGTTQFESTDARRAFPCFDEPEFKAVFSISLKLDQNLVAISNSSILNEIRHSDGTKTVNFNETIKMSTYLVAFIIGPFEESRTVHVNNIPIKIISVKGKKHLTNYALRCAKFFLAYFNEYYGINYPGDKLDLIAIPDFASGAMENFGCITFRETLLLVEENRATETELTRIADVIAHEIAHMWFGDLVTMKWWNGIWLNEAFATFMATKAVDNFNPDWERWVQFGFERSAAFDIDSLEGTRPIEYPVISPNDASGMFDLLTYEKGGSVLRMLEQYLGEEPFQNGVKEYLRIHKFSNTETNDLWESLEKITNQPVRKTMESWIFQSGYPRIKVSQENDSLNLEQSIFKYNHLSTRNLLWSIPVILKSLSKSGESKYKILMQDHTQQIKLKNSSDMLHLINVGGDGFYRVQYSKKLFLKILDNVNPQTNMLSQIERFCLLDDYWSDVLSCNQTIDYFLQDLQYFKYENDPEVLNLIISCLSSIDRLLSENNVKEFREYTKDFFQFSLNKIGFKNQKNDTNKLKEYRAALIRALGNLCRDKDMMGYCLELFNKFRNNPKSVEANALAATISVLSTNGDSSLYSEFLDLYNNASTPQEEMRFLFSLSSFPNKNDFINTLELSMTQKVRTQNAPYLLGQTLKNKHFYTISWDFIEKNWDKINSRFPENSIPRLLTGIRSISNDNYSKKIQSFLKSHKVPQGQKTVDQHLEKLNVNVKFASFQLRYLNEYLVKRDL